MIIFVYVKVLLRRLKFKRNAIAVGTDNPFFVLFVCFFVFFLFIHPDLNLVQADFFINVVLKNLLFKKSIEK